MSVPGKSTPMTILESAFEQLSDDIDTGKTKEYDYDLKVEILLKEGTESVQGKAFLTQTIATLQSARQADEIIEFYDTDNNHVPPDLAGLKGNEIGNKFRVEVTKGRKKSYIFGLKIKTTIPFSTIKDRTLAKLNAGKTYIRIHHGGFYHGVNWVNLGFLMNQHPTTSNKHDVSQDIKGKIYKAWINDDKYWTPNKKHEMKMMVNPEATEFNPFQIPLSATPVSVTSKFGDSIHRTTVTMITTPLKFVKSATEIMDYLLLHAHDIDGYVPMPFKYESPEAFHNIIERHSNWMQQHRNLQIQFVDHYKVVTLSGKDGKSILQYLQAQAPIIAIHKDPHNNRFNLSIDASVFQEMAKQIHEYIQAQSFPFEITVRMPKLSNTSGHSITSTTRYQHALASISSKTETNREPTTDNSSQNSRNAWRSRIPVTINFNNDTDDFPPLSTNNHNNTSQASEPSNTTITMTTVTTAVAAALAKAREDHTNEMTLLRNEIKAMRETFQMMMTTITSQSETINQHISHLATPKGPSPPRKKRPPQGRGGPVRLARTPNDQSMEVDFDPLSHIVTSLADNRPSKNWGSETEDEVSSSHTDADASGGRED